MSTQLSIPGKGLGGRERWAMRIYLYSLMLFGILTPSTAQNWEAGGAAGFGFYRGTAINGPTGSGRAGFGRALP